VPSQGFWYNARRDRAINAAYIAGQEVGALARAYGLSYLHVIGIIRKVWEANSPPGWVDEWGRPWAWTLPLTALRAAPPLTPATETGISEQRTNHRSP